MTKARECIPVALFFALVTPVAPPPSDYTEPDANGGDVKPLAKAGAGVPIAPFVSVTALALLVLIAVLVRRRAIGFERRPDSNASVRLRS